MGRRAHEGVRPRWGTVAALVLLAMLACNDKNPEPAPEPHPKEEKKEEKPWIPVAKKVLLDTYPLTETTGIEYCGMLCEQADKHVFATVAISGTERKCNPWASPCPEGTTAIGTYHTQPVGPLNEANPRRPFSPDDILVGTEPYDFVAQALAPRTTSGLDVHVYMFERGIQTECQVHPTVICPFPPITRGAAP